MIIEDQVLLELKAGRAIERAHEAQLLNYLRCSNIEVGLVLNFGPQPQFRRLVFDNARKKLSPTTKETLAETASKVGDLPASTAKFPNRSASSAKSAAGF